MNEENINRIKYKSKLQIGNKEIRCYILEDGTRYFNGEDLENFLLGKIKMSCYKCEKDMPELAETLKNLEVKEPKLFNALVGEKLVCDTCEKKFEKQLEEKK